MKRYICYVKLVCHLTSLSETQKHINLCLLCLLQMVQELAALQEELQEEKFLLQETDEVTGHLGVKPLQLSLTPQKLKRIWYGV